MGAGREGERAQTPLHEEKRARLKQGLRLWAGLGQVTPHLTLLSITSYSESLFKLEEEELGQYREEEGADNSNVRD